MIITFRKPYVRFSVGALDTDVLDVAASVRKKHSDILKLQFQSSFTIFISNLRKMYLSKMDFRFRNIFCFLIIIEKKKYIYRTEIVVISKSWMCWKRRTESL